MFMRRFICLMFALGCLALAHQPLLNAGSASRESPYEITDVGVSKVITAQSQGAGQHWYRLTVPAGFALDATLFVGASCAASFAPDLWLVGPGLPQVTAPFDTGSGGAVMVTGRWTAYQGHGLSARKGQTLRRTLGAGTYFLVVNRDQAPGWMMLSMGGREEGGGTPDGRAALTRFNRCR